MAAVRTFTLPHYEAYPVHVALFKDVTNAAFLKSQLLEANPDFDYAFLDASMVGDLTVSCHNPSVRSIPLWLCIR
jgi:EKC/KEOPS complex subunit CGI121/TPRKB